MYKLLLKSAIFLLPTTLLVTACNDHSIDESSSAVSNSSKMIFISETNTQGSFTIPDADSICQNDAHKPSGGGTYKAMVVLGTTRRACSTDMCGGGSSEHIDWVLAASTTYLNIDGDTIGTTDSNGLLPATLTNAINSSAGYAWTGIEYEVAVEEDKGGMTNNRWLEAGNNCNGWTNDTSGNAGEIGDPTTSTYQFADIGNNSCGNSFSFYCVEQ